MKVLVDTNIMLEVILLIIAGVRVNDAEDGGS